MSSLVALLLAAAPLLRDDTLALRPEWTPVALPAQRLPLTRYSAQAIDDRRALRIDAAGSYGNLVQRLPEGGAAARRIRWSWRVEQASPAIGLRQKARDDSPARVCLAFAWPDERVPFVERQLLRLARWRTGLPLPAATLCWAWGGPADVPGSVIDSPYTRRVRVIVLRSGTGGWHDEERDVEADLRRAFGDEWPQKAPSPAASALIVAADADNTASRSTAWIADLRLD
jgi:hypothetical protein